MRDWLTLRARATPTKTAVVAAGTAEAINYQTLNERVERLAARLAGLNVEPGDHVGVLMGTRPAYVSLVHATARVGGVLVPLNARYTAEEIDAVVDRADVDLLVCDKETEATAAEVRPPVVSIDESDTGVRELTAVTAATVEHATWLPEQTVLLLATSGTTGDPKIVRLSLRNLAASAAGSSWRLGVLPEDRWYCMLPMYHMGGLAPVFRSVLYGTAVVVATPGSFDPEQALAEMATFGATCTSVVPTMLQDLLEADDGTLADLRFVLTGGAATPEPLVTRACEADVAVRPSYGMTEAASQIATARASDVATAPGSVGPPLLFSQVTVVKSDGTKAPPGEPGELVVSGPAVTAGYYNDQAATDATFGPHGFHTGDAGYRDEAGRVWVLNRLDDRIVSGGENVDPGEVASVLRDHPAVDGAFVLGLADDRYGERVAALLTGSLDPADVDDVEAFARNRLAGFKIPRTWRVVDELPRTASGTVDRDAARTLLEKDA